MLLCLSLYVFSSLPPTHPLAFHSPSNPRLEWKPICHTIMQHNCECCLQTGWLTENTADCRAPAAAARRCKEQHLLPSAVRHLNNYHQVRASESDDSRKHDVRGHRNSTRLWIHWNKYSTSLQHKKNRSALSLACGDEAKYAGAAGAEGKYPQHDRTVFDPSHDCYI